MARRTLTSMPTSFRLLETLIEAGGQLTMDCLSQKSKMPGRSISRALRELRSFNLVCEKRSGFGKPLTVILTEKGSVVASYLRRIDHLINQDHQRNEWGSS
jgi:DNA-binding transcriptional ArsR family regulator